jgi:hypothetical protein
MQVELGQLSVEGLTLELPPHVSNGVPLPARRATVREAKGLRGTMSTDDGGVQLRDVAASELVLGALDWHFGVKTFLVTERPAKFGGVRAQIASGESGLDLDVELSNMQAERLQLTAGTLQVATEADALTLKLAVHGDDIGTLTAEQALFRDFELRTGELVMRAPELRVQRLNVDWGGERFKLEAATAEGETLTVSVQGSVITANEVALATFKLHGDDYTLGEGRFGTLGIDATLPTESAQPSAPSLLPKSKVSLFDYAVLDGLSGHLNVDVHLDIALPIIQHRRATHELRIPIEQGAIDYRKLESNLAALEDSLIDFSVRDGALVLEVGLPLIRTRGRGKPILRWDLSPADLELAEARRVRLAVLPNVRSATASEAAPKEAPKGDRNEEDKESSVRLRHLALENLDAVLTLAPGRSDAAALRELSFDDLQLTGAVHHDPEDTPREGTVRGSMRSLHARLERVPVGPSALRAELDLASLAELSVNLLDLKPQKVHAKLERLTLKAVALTPGR